MDEYSCDTCGAEVPNGSGHYPNGETGDRVCEECYVELVTRQLVECLHPIGTWQHHYDPDSTLGDYYTCGDCGEITQVG